MSWQHDAQRARRAYSSDGERKNYSAGYSDGFHGYEQWVSSDRNYYPNAYCAGYWDGQGDR